MGPGNPSIIRSQYSQTTRLLRDYSPAKSIQPDVDCVQEVRGSKASFIPGRVSSLRTSDGGSRVRMCSASARSSPAVPCRMRPPFFFCLFRRRCSLARRPPTVEGVLQRPAWHHHSVSERALPYSPHICPYTHQSPDTTRQYSMKAIYHRQQTIDTHAPLSILYSQRDICMKRC